MKVSYTHESVRLTGRWDIRNPRYAETTAPGSYLEFAFEGRMATAIFDIETNATPHLHLWIEVDGGVRTEAPIDRYLRVMAPDDGFHICRIIFKGSTEVDRRWFLPLTGKVSFVGVNTDKPVAIPEDTRKTVEFVGDSITEGVLIDTDYYADGEPASYIDLINRIYQDDVCATYAWLTAEALHLRPIFMGYGAVGVTRPGQGKVPAAPVSYPYNFDGSPISRPEPNYIIINHGANDRHHAEQEYLEKYEELLNVIRSHNPHAKILALSAFCGAHHEALGTMIRAYNEKHECEVAFIDSTGWVPEEPLHPMRDGHAVIAEHLTELLKEWIQ